LPSEIGHISSREYEKLMLILGEEAEAAEVERRKAERSQTLRSL